jgi:F-type H+-transporting ATPase subunit gamma
MASLKEIKGRIGSVKSTLKITSAMKLVASAKLRKAQQAVQSMSPYEQRLHAILGDLMTDYAVKVERGAVAVSPDMGEAFTAPRAAVRRVALVAVSSNSSLCGGFNANVVRELFAAMRYWEAEGAEVSVIPVGRKVAEAVRKVGVEVPDARTRLSERPSYDGAAALATELTDGYLSGRFDRVEVIWNHFVSVAAQQVRREAFLPLPGLPGASAPEAPADAAAEAPMSGPARDEALRGNFIVEPSTEEEVRLLLPKVLKINIYTLLLDSNAAEHAARTVAMQMATDNGEELLRDLTLEYNKGRQQKITSEILDLVGGSMDR